MAGCGRVVLTLTVEEQRLRLELLEGTDLPITLTVSWDERLQVAGAIAAAITAGVRYLRQQRR
jgi:hypothetical protein